MRSLFVVLLGVSLLTLGACTDSGSASLTGKVDSQAKDIDGLRGRVATLEKQVDTMKLAEVKREEQLADTSRRLRVMESTLLRVGIDSSLEVPPPASASSNVYQSSSSSRSASAAPLPPPAPSSSSRSTPVDSPRTASPAPAGPRVITAPKPAFDEESYRQANNFFNLEDRTKAFCNRKWPGDADMATYCYGKQISAAQTLDRNRSFTDGEKAKRTECFKKWGADFEMRLYCEGR